MRATDIFKFAYHALKGYPVRSALMLAAMAIGVAAVVFLTALGEGARRYVTGEFASLGSHLLIVLPGRSETTGGHPPILGETPRDLTLDDAYALLRSPRIRQVAPVVLGSAPASWRRRERESTVIGSTAALKRVRHLELAQGRFLPETDPREAVAVCVLGAAIREELFGPAAALGEWVRLGDRRFRVVGVLAPQGQSIGLDLNEVVIVPVASAQALFDSPSLFRILAEARSREDLPRAAAEIRDIIRDRHEGEEDITVITQDAVVATLDRIFGVLTLTVAGIAGVSLAVAGILIMNVMLVAISERTAEIGLLKALGAGSGKIQFLFLAEAGLLSLTGALSGAALGLLGVWMGRQLYPALPLAPPVWALIGALSVGVGAGLLFGVLPARRAARLDPVQALSGR
jgi:putative ABC transport system permease protein